MRVKAFFSDSPYWLIILFKKSSRGSIDCPVLSLELEPWYLKVGFTMTRYSAISIYTCGVSMCSRTSNNVLFSSVQTNSCTGWSDYTAIVSVPY